MDLESYISFNDRVLTNSSGYRYGLLFFVFVFTLELDLNTIFNFIELSILNLVIYMIFTYRFDTETFAVIQGVPHMSDDNTFFFSFLSELENNILVSS